MTDFGNWPGRIDLIDRWWERVLEAAQGSSRLTEAERLLEAETKIDFADWLHGYVATSFYQAFEEVGSQWRKYAGVKPLRDFKEHRIKGRNRLVGFGYVGDHAHKPGMRRSFRPEASLFIDTYGAEHEITRQAIINQESEEFLRDDPQDMGSAAADFLARAVIALMISNPNAPDGAPMYSGSRGNEFTAALSAASMMAAYSAGQTQRDDDDRPMRMNYAHLIVQNATMGAIARRDLTSQTTGYTSTGGGGSQFERGTDNPLRNLPWQSDDFVIEEPYLPDANDYYFVADPNRFPAFMVGLLRGQEEPALYQNTPQRRAIGGGGGDDGYQLSVPKLHWEVEWDIGVAAVEPKATARGVVA